MKIFKLILKKVLDIQFCFFHTSIKDNIVYTKRQNYMFEHFFKNCFEYFNNLRIILLMLNNFNDEIVNFILKKLQE